MKQKLRQQNEKAPLKSCYLFIEHKPLSINHNYYIQTLEEAILLQKKRFFL